MVCVKCGFNNPDENVSCIACGAQLSTSATTSTEATGASLASSARQASSGSSTASHSATTTRCDIHPDVICVPCANCTKALCEQCTTAGVLVKLYPSGFILCNPCYQQALLRPGFCPDCEADVEFVDEVENYHDFNFFSSYFGEAEQCPKCNSVVRTRWFGSIFPLGLFLLPFLPLLSDIKALKPLSLSLVRLSVIPFIPLASYRDRQGAVQGENENEDRYFFQRGRTQIRPKQVLRTAMFWFIPIALIILSFFTYVYIDQQNRQRAVPEPIQKTAPRTNAK